MGKLCTLVLFIGVHVCLQDEVVSPHSLAFSRCGDKIYCGFSKCVRVFSTSRPGRECSVKSIYGASILASLVPATARVAVAEKNNTCIVFGTNNYTFYV